VDNWGGGVDNLWITLLLIHRPVWNRVFPRLIHRLIHKFSTELSTGSSEALSDEGEVFLERSVSIQELLDLLNRIEYRRVIPTAEELSNLRE
jgi:hypothetical protein